MGQAISLAAIYCCCSASSCLCNSCFGTVAVGTTGRKRSVLLLGIVIACSLWFQYYVGPSIVHQSGTIWKIFKFIPGTSSVITSAWLDDANGCQQYYDEFDQVNSMKLVEQCAGNAGVFRPTCLSTFYFIANAIATKFNPLLNRQAWPAKYALFVCSLFISVFISNSPLFTGIFLWIARFGSFIFVILQQIILIDVAYNWNDDWVERANESDRLAFGSGSNWLHAIVGICVSLYTTCLIFISLLFVHYTGTGDDDSVSCAGNTWVITLTLLGIIGITFVQLCGTEGSLLVSGVISCYAVYLAYCIVSSNPIGECNPNLGRNDVWGISIGLLLTTVSLIWTGWSWSAETRLTAESVQSAKAVSPINNNGSTGGGELNLDVPLLDGQEAATIGIVGNTGGDSAGTENTAVLQSVWKLNVVMALISCYVAMILTGWGTVDVFIDDGNNHNAANPMIGRVNMVIIGISQWLALLLYTWTLVASTIFPDRDFT